MTGVQTVCSSDLIEEDEDWRGNADLSQIGIVDWGLQVEEKGNTR